ncbi:GW domain-containing glycosaminoglycan-binding protein [uncultured Vagococcus sp.]|uniref:GW domain-containing glycosaminoglycan-binding protein n=1 Tax=uncultured Vagococcus sp. TaxID=189676 RepID=UPI0028D73E5F|nr:GW domain-containing glycosaminoglycan-binding protein [uncultured Vagococcus sp.]
MKKLKYGLKITLVSILLLSNSLPGSIAALAEENTKSSNIATDGKVAESMTESVEGEFSSSSSIDSSSERSENEEVNRLLTNPFADNPYFPEEPTEQDIKDASILPGEIPLAELQQQLRGFASSYSYSNYLSSNNNQIIKYPHANIVTNYKPQFPKFGYAEGVGKPRGIVIHETANPNSTIWNEINYMTNNYKNAFVQAFADANNIIEIHPTDYAAWGAGPNANPYFVHIELVEHSNKTDFYKSVNNQAYYAAHILKRYNLLPGRAAGGKGNPQGSVWGHFEVSSLLGGTNHSDPVGYFQKYGYSFNEFYELVQYHYNTLNYTIITEEKEVNSQGLVIQSEDIFSKPRTTIEAIKTSSTVNSLNKYVSVTKEATTSDGKKHYYSKELGGWVSTSSINLYDAVEYSKTVNYKGSIKATSEAGIHGIYDGIYNSGPGISNVGVNTLYENQDITIIGEAKTNRAIWYQFTNTNGVVGWMDSKAFVKYDNILYEKTVNISGMVNTEQIVGNQAIYDGIYNTKPLINIVGQGKQFAEQSVTVTKEAKTDQGVWYYFEYNGREVGWIESKAIVPVDKIEYDKAVDYTLKIKPLDQAKNHGIYPKIYNTAVNNIGFSAAPYASKGVKVAREAKTSRATWYQFFVDGKLIGWLDSRAFETYDIITDQKDMNMLAKIVPLAQAKNHGVYNEIYNTSPNAIGTTATAYAAKGITIVKQARTTRALWYQFALDGKIIGWMDSRAFVMYDTITNENTQNLWAQVLSNDQVKNHGVFKEIYNTGPNAIGLSAGTPYASKVVKIIKEARTKSALWYQFTVEGKLIGWMDSRAFSLYDVITDQKTLNVWAKILPNEKVKGHGVFSEIYRTSPTAVGLSSGTPYAGKGVKIIQEAKTSRAHWYQFSLDGNIIGWMDSRAFTAYDSIVYKKDVMYQKEIKQGITHGVYNGIYNTDPSVVNIGTNIPYFKKKVVVIAEAKTARAVWYQFAVEGKTIGWMDSQAFTDINDVNSTFVYESAISAQKAIKGGDLFASVMIAQAILESNYGKSELGTAPNHNLFGIKGKYNGAYVMKDTLEFDVQANKWVTVKAEFKKYPSKQESFEDNGDKLLNGVSWDKNYYRGTWKSVAKNYQNATKFLTGKYATDPTYHDKLNRIITEWNLTQYD